MLKNIVKRRLVEFTTQVLQFNSVLKFFSMSFFQNWIETEFSKMQFYRQCDFLDGWAVMGVWAVKM